MKRFSALLLALTIVLTLTVSAGAVGISNSETGVNQTLRVNELQSELQSAEKILGGECKLDSQEIERVGDYVVETRLYVLEDEDVASARTGGCGGVSSHTWRRYGADEWDIKVLFGAFFYYNGQTAICRPEESNFWVIRPDNSIITTNFNPQESYRDSGTLTSKATASCQYARDEPGTSSDIEIFGTLKVTCTKDGTVGIESEVEHRY